MDNVIYTPGNEPESIRKRIDRLFAKLDEAYPDKVIVSLNKDHKKWGETVTQLYRLLGYSSGKVFLEAYGYTVSEQKAGRKAGNHAEIIAELKRRYPEGPTCSTMLELREQNPDLAPKFKNIINQSSALFGMTFAKYLVQEGILLSKHTSESLPEEEKKEATPKLTVEEKLKQTTEKLKEKYSEDNPFSGTMVDLAEELDGVSMRAFSNQIRKVHNQSVKEYLVSVGIMAKPKQKEKPRADEAFTTPQKTTKTEAVCIDGVFYIEDGVLKKYTGKQREIIIPDCVTRIDDDLFYDNGTTRKVFIPDSVSSFGWRTFEECHILKEVRLSEALVEITPDAFKHTLLKRIVIPAGVRQISRDAFANCEKLDEVIIYSKKINISPSAFDGSPNVIIYCHDHLISDIHRVTGVPCMSLSSVPAEKDADKDYYYDNTELMSSFSDKESVGKTKSYKVNIGTQEFTVRLKAESCIEEYTDGYPFYTFIEVENNYISIEESRQEIIDADPNMGTDAYLYDARPRVDEKNAQKMGSEDSFIRFDFLKKVYRSLNDEKTIQLIAEEAPKTDNGTFSMEAFLRIACAGIVNFDCCILEIVAMPENDTSLEITVKDIFFSPEEVNNLRNDFFTRHVLKDDSAEKVSDETLAEPASVPSTKRETSELSISLGNISIPVTVIETEDGSRAIDTNPIRILGSFDFLSGSDEDGYIIHLPDYITTVESAGIQVEVYLDRTTFSDAWKEIKALSQYYHNPDKDIDEYQAVMDVVDYRGMNWTLEKLNRLTASNEFISRYVYAVLRTIEHIKTHFEEYAKKSADTAPRKKNGDLWSGKPTQFSGFLMEEMELDNYGYSSFVNAYAEKNNTVRMIYEGAIEV